MEITSMIFSKDTSVVNDQIQYSTSMMVTLKSRGDDGWPKNFDIGFMSLADLELLHKFVDDMIHEEEIVTN